MLKIGDIKDDTSTLECDKKRLDEFKRISSLLDDTAQRIGESK